jgi:formate dehydrogenase subunit gamma
MPDSDSKALAAEVTARWANEPGALLPVLHAVQDQLGYIPPECVAVIAAGLNLSRAEVHGVISFYSLLRSTPGGQHTISVCRAESCQAMGAGALEQHVMTRLGIGYHETTADGRYSLEPVYCLGNCACSPSITIDAELHSRVDPGRFDELLDL